MPNKYFEWLFDRLRYDYGMRYTSENMSSIFLDGCEQTLPTIWLLFGGFWFQVDPHDYIIQYGADCFVCITRGEDHWILGNAFMRGYYIVHDLDTLQFGITPSSISTKEAVSAGSIPPGTKKVNPTLEKAINYSLGGVGMTVASLLLYKFVLTKDPFELDPSLSEKAETEL